MDIGNHVWSTKEMSGTNCGLDNDNGELLGETGKILQSERILDNHEKIVKQVQHEKEQEDELLRENEGEEGEIADDGIAEKDLLNMDNELLESAEDAAETKDQCVDDEEQGADEGLDAKKADEQDADEAAAEEEDSHDTAAEEDAEAAVAEEDAVLEAEEQDADEEAVEEDADEAAAEEDAVEAAAEEDSIEAAAEEDADEAAAEEDADEDADVAAAEENAGVATADADVAAAAAEEDADVAAADEDYDEEAAEETEPQDMDTENVKGLSNPENIKNVNSSESNSLSNELITSKEHPQTNFLTKRTDDVANCDQEESAMETEETLDTGDGGNSSEAKVAEDKVSESHDEDMSLDEERPTVTDKGSEDIENTDSSSTPMEVEASGDVTLGATADSVSVNTSSGDNDKSKKQSTSHDTEENSAPTLEICSLQSVNYPVKSSTNTNQSEKHDELSVETKAEKTSDSAVDSESADKESAPCHDELSKVHESSTKTSETSDKDGASKESSEENSSVNKSTTDDVDTLTTTIKKEPDANSSDLSATTASNSVAAVAPDNSAAKESSSGASASPKSTETSESSAASKDKAAPGTTESDVKIKEEARSPKPDSSQAEKTTQAEKTASTNSNESASQDTDASDAQKKAAGSSRCCTECGVAKGMKYQVLFQGKARFLCSDDCFKAFRSKQKLQPTAPSQGTKADSCGICNRNIKNGQGYFPFSGDSKPVCSEECMVKYQQAHTPKPSCAQCKTLIEGRTKCLTWETMEFCNEDCLGSYQATMGSHCACCRAAVLRLSLGKYCVRFGADIRQFCSGKCLEEFKKGLKVCTFCQKDMSNTAEGFLAPVGDKFRDFCTAECMEHYEALNAANSTTPSNQKCSVCQKLGPAKVQVTHKDREHILCSDPCIAAFRYTQKIYATLCDLCHKFFNNEPLCLQIENSGKKFCTKICLNLFVLAHRKIVPCTWCKVKKYNFDMIERVDQSNNTQQFCSLNCLSLFRVSLNATSSRCIKCDHCHLNLPAQYHLTMSDASIRNFCSYPCVIKFQGQFTSVPTLTTVTPSLNRQGPIPVGKATTVAPPSVVVNSASTTNNSTNNGSTPVIANVMSLASLGPTPVAVSAAPKSTSSMQTVGVSPAVTSATTNGTPLMREVHREVIVAPPVPRMLKNKMIMCKPLVQNKGVACKPHPCHKETQTDGPGGTPTLIPIPIPIFVPSPVHMYSRPVPFPMPFPIPIPVPIFIPTTRTTTAKVIKDIFEIQERVPTNPFEAELLMMAEMVAADEKNNEADKKEEEEEEAIPTLSKIDSKEESGPKSASTTELPEPLQDLEVSVLPPAPIPYLENTQPVVELTPLAEDFLLNENYSEDSYTVDDVAPKDPIPTPTVRRGVKRGKGRGRGRGRKRQKVIMDSDTSDEEWLPNEVVPEVVTLIKNVPPYPSSVTPKTTAPVTPKTTAPVTPKTPVPSTPKAVVAPAVPATTTFPMVVAVNKSEEKKTPGDGTSPDANLCLKYMFGVNAWKHWVVQKNVELDKGSQTRRLKLFKTDLLQLSPDELNYSLCLFVKEVRKPNGEEYAPDSIHYLCLGIQLYLFENGRVDNIFSDPYYEKFTECLNDVLLKHDIIGTLRKEAHFVSRIEEEILWEAKQLGAHSPQVLLNTLMYFNTKLFYLQSVDDHLQLAFTYIMKGWRKLYNNTNTAGNKVLRCAVLRYYPPPARGSVESKKGWREDAFTYEQEENFDNPLRCPVKLYEFYLSKCPESIRQRNDLFYMSPERSCVPDSPVWYSTQPLAKEALVKMLQRIYLVREISSPPVSNDNKTVTE